MTGIEPAKQLMRQITYEQNTYKYYFLLITETTTYLANAVYLDGIDVMFFNNTQ